MKILKTFRFWCLWLIDVLKLFHFKYCFDPCCFTVSFHNFLKVCSQFMCSHSCSIIDTSIRWKLAQTFCNWWDSSSSTKWKHIHPLAFAQEGDVQYDTICDLILAITFHRWANNVITYFYFPRIWRQINPLFCVKGSANTNSFYFIWNFNKSLWLAQHDAIVLNVNFDL